MGLDIVEFVMEIEKKFHIHISDQDGQQLTTPRRCIDYVYRRLPHSRDGVCMSQRAFHRLRRVLIARTGLPSRSIHPQTEVLVVLPEASREKIWEASGRDLAGKSRWWPELPRRRWFPSWFPSRVGDLVKLLVVHYPLTEFEEDRGWTRAKVGKIIYDLIMDNFGVDMSRYSDDASFREDMGID